MPGLDNQLIDRLNGTYICYRRSDVTFHDIMDKKLEVGMKNAQFCGSFRNANKRYRAFNNDQLCFPNDIDFVSKTINPSSNSTTRYQKLNRNWSVKLINNNELNNPIVRFHYSMSAPCVNSDIPLMLRPRPITRLFRQLD